MTATVDQFDHLTLLFTNAIADATAVNSPTTTDAITNTLTVVIY